MMAGEPAPDPDHERVPWEASWAREPAALRSILLACQRDETASWYPDPHVRTACTDRQTGEASGMNDYMSKPNLLGLIQRDRAQWEALLGSIPEAWMTEPGVEGEWS